MSLRLLPAALQKQEYDLAAYVLVYGLVKASVRKPKNSVNIRRLGNSHDSKKKRKEKG